MKILLAAGPPGGQGISPVAIGMMAAFGALKPPAGKSGVSSKESVSRCLVAIR
jgi:hypothetical protein